MTTVLIADPDPDILDLLRDALELEGLDCLLATDGPAVLALARTRRPGLVIVEAGLPGIGGAEICRRLRRDPATATVPILLLTGGARPASGPPAVGDADAYLPKPFDLSELVALARRLMGGR